MFGAVFDEYRQANNRAEMRSRRQAANLGFQLMPAPKTDS